MSTLQSEQIAEFVDVIASEVCHAAATAVERWMTEVESALTDPRLTSLGRLNAAQDVIARYKQIAGKADLHPHRTLRAS